MMSDYLTLAAQHLGVDVDDVMKFRLAGDDAVVVVDYGIAGGKKYILPLSSLQPALDDSTTTTFDLDYRDLQALAKEQGINARQTKEALIEALWPLDIDEEE